MASSEIVLTEETSTRRICAVQGHKVAIRSEGWRTAGAILKASPDTLRRRLQEPEANPWAALADMTNTASEARLQAAALRARGELIAALPHDTAARILSAAIGKLEQAIEDAAWAAGGAP